MSEKGWMNVIAKGAEAKNVRCKCRTLQHLVDEVTSWRHICIWGLGLGRGREEEEGKKEERPG